MASRSLEAVAAILYEGVCMRIISEITNKEYPTVDECLKAEAAWKAKEDERLKAEKIKAEEKRVKRERLDALRAAANDAFDEYRKALAEYNKQYGIYDDSFLKFLIG